MVYKSRCDTTEEKSTEITQTATHGESNSLEDVMLPSWEGKKKADEAEGIWKEITSKTEESEQPTDPTKVNTEEDTSRLTDANVRRT